MIDRDVQDSEGTTQGLEVWDVNLFIVDDICPRYMHTLLAKGLWGQSATKTAAQRSCVMSPSLEVMVNNSDDIFWKYTATAKEGICKTLRTAAQRACAMSPSHPQSNYGKSSQAELNTIIKTIILRTVLHSIQIKKKKWFHWMNDFSCSGMNGVEYGREGKKGNLRQLFRQIGTYKFVRSRIFRTNIWSCKTTNF